MTTTVMSHSLGDVMSVALLLVSEGFKVLLNLESDNAWRGVSEEGLQLLSVHIDVASTLYVQGKRGTRARLEIERDD